MNVKTKNHVQYISLNQEVAAGVSSCPGLGFHDSGQLGLPLVAILNQLLLVVEELLVEEGRVFEVGALDDGVDGAGLLAEAAVDALGHVNIVARRAPGAVSTLLRLNGDGLCGADGLAQLARDTSAGRESSIMHGQRLRSRSTHDPHTPHPSYSPMHHNP